MVCLVHLVYLVGLVHELVLFNQINETNQANPITGFFSILLARIIHECRREAFETEARLGFSQVRPT